VRVFLDQARHPSRRPVADRIHAKPLCRNPFRHQRQDLEQQGVSRVSGLHECGEASGDQEPESRWRGVQPGDVSGLEAQVPKQVGDGAEGVRQLSLPVRIRVFALAGGTLTRLRRSRYHLSV